MTTAATIVAELLLDAAGFKKGIDGASKSADTFSKKMKNIGGQMTKVGGVMTAGLTLPLVAFGASAVRGALEAEDAMAELEAVIASTGGVAGLTAQELEKMAVAWERTTKFSAEAVMDGQSMLLTFTKIGKDVFPQATEAVLNMAEKFGSVDQASIMLGKALNDPIAGVAALRRVGIQLTAAQEEQIKQFMAVGDIASAQKVILGELETQFGGLAVAAGKTTSGQMEIFKNRMGELTDQIGAALIPVLIRFMEAVTPIIEAFIAAPPQVQTFIVVLGALLAAAGPVIAILGAIVSGIGAIAPVVAAIGPAIAAIVSGIGALGPIVAAIGAALAPVLLPILVIIAAVAVAVGLLYLAWKTNFFGIRETAETVWAALKLVFQAFQAALSGDWTKFGELLREAWDLVWGLVEKRIQKAWGVITDAARRIVHGIRSVFHINWQELGHNIILGIINGLYSGVRWVIDAAQSVAKAIVDAIKGFLGISSPSKIMMEFGEMTAKGFALGMLKNNDLSIPKALVAGAGGGTLVSSTPSRGNVVWNDHRRFDSRLSAEDRNLINQDTLRILEGAFSNG